MIIAATHPQSNETKRVSAWVIERNLNDLNEVYRDYMTVSAACRYDEAAALKINLDTLAGWFMGHSIALSCDSQSFKLRKDEIVP